MSRFLDAATDNVHSAVMLFLAVLFTLCPKEVFAQYRERAGILPQYTWRLEDLYASDEVWGKTRETLRSKLDGISQYKGKLAKSASDLLACLSFNSDFSKELARLYCYASMKSDEDTRNSKYLAMKLETEQLQTEYGSRASFIEPEIAAMDKGTIDAFLREKPELVIYRMYLYDVLRTKEHRLSPGEEKILAESAMLADGPATIYSVLSNAELPYPEVKLSDGTTARLDKAGYARYRTVLNRQDREAVFQAFWRLFDGFKQTFGVQLNANVRKDMFYARTRKYKSSLESALDKNNIPTRVYASLIENVTNNLDSFHRYLRLRKRMLGVDVLKYSDMYVPVVKEVDLKYTFDQAKDIVLRSVELLGDDYCRVAKGAFENRWIDVYPTLAKHPGAYSNGSAYDVHPYILLNFNGQYDDVSTLAHELGHSMHSYYSNKKQPYPTADCPTFVAEVASTFSEALLAHNVLKDIHDTDTRLSLLMNYLDVIRLTVFRQAQFAEFELCIHEKAERGEALTGDVLNQLYDDILKKYYGNDKGICRIDDLYVVEWAYVQHFYYNFYVYQYATSFTAATALAERIFGGEQGAADKYIELISAGGSDYPIELLKKAGVDMTTSDPFNKTVAVMNRTMDEIESLLDKEKGARR
jgi:oligoendopeptidase F